MPLALTLAFAGVVIVMDQCAKAAAAPGSPRARPSEVRTWPFTYHLNTRPALARASRCRLLTEWALTGAGLLGLLGAVPWSHTTAAAVGIGLVFGGISSNARDLWRHRGVRDYVEVGWWPVFNLADAAIVAGLLSLVAALVSW